jgi:hypothetical protein
MAMVTKSGDSSGSPKKGEEMHEAVYKVISSVTEEHYLLAELLDSAIEQLEAGNIDVVREGLLEARKVCVGGAAQLEKLLKLTITMH